MIDICGTAPEGSGMINLRKCIIRCVIIIIIITMITIMIIIIMIIIIVIIIIRTKYKYDAATEDRQIVWKKMIINFIERSASGGYIVSCSHEVTVASRGTCNSCSLCSILCVVLCNIVLYLHLEHVFYSDSLVYCTILTVCMTCRMHI